MTNRDKNKIIHTLNMYKSFGIEYLDEINFNNKSKKAVDLPDDFINLENHVGHCNLCTLSKQKESLAFGIGDINSDIFIISTDEYFENKELYNMFKNMIEKVLLRDINSVYITNILKCDTNNKIQNKKSLDDAISKCMNYLVKQIELSSVKLIITLGDCFNYMMDSNDDVLDISGNVYDYDGVKLIPIINPAYLQKNPSYKQQMFDDLRKIKTIME
jgi:DNA polymerase